MWKRCRSTAKRYPGDNRLIVPKSPYRRHCVAPRCRLIASWGRSRSQGLGCSPIKAVRELGLERRHHCVSTEQSVDPHRLISVKPRPRHRTSGQGNTEGRPAITNPKLFQVRNGFSVADVEQHPCSKGWLVPVTTSPIRSIGEMGLPALWQIYETHNTPAPRNGVKV